MMKMIYKKGIYYCPECGSRKVVEVQQHLIFKRFDLNTKNFVSLYDKSEKMNLPSVVFSYDNSQCIGVLCYECVDCKWYYCGALEEAAETEEVENEEKE